jgi:hypothetical protein
VISLLLTVALAAHGGHPNGNGEVVGRSIPKAVEDSLVTLVAVTYAIVVVTVIIAAYRYRGEWREPQSHWLPNSIVSLMS